MRTAVAFAVMAGAFGGGAFSQPSPTPTPLAHERFNIATLYVTGPLDNHYGGELHRLGSLCRSQHGGCSSRDFEPTRRRVAVLHSEPNVRSRAVGALHGVLNSPYSDQTLAVALDFEAAERPGLFLNWKKHEDGYSYLAPGVRARGSWIQLIGPPFPASAWLNLQGSPLEGSVDSITNNILHLDSLSATGAEGRRVQVKPGSYLMLRVSTTHVEFREEVESDMPCEDPVKPPAVMPPTLRAAPDAFFDRSGRARFAIVYTKGC